jgi:diguanylate cyclase (GGDEF)-like protein
MAPLPPRSAGLGSRVAVRTYLLFCLCSVAPIVLLAALGYGYIRTEVLDLAQSKLDTASKRYGVLLFERLGELDAFLAERARLRDSTPTPETRSPFLASRMRNVHIEEAPEGTAQGKKLDVVDVNGTPTLRVRATEIVDGHAITAVGDPLPDYLWNTDAADVPDISFCVFTSAGVRLHCADDARSTPTSDALQGKWQLFMRAGYGSGDWLIRAQQAREAALPALRPFRTTLLAAAGLAIAIALLVGSIQIRRSHGPLAVLTSAARRMSRGRFDAPVQIAGQDEYAGLARVFNRMAGSLRRQFQLLSAFARIDRLMLARPAVEPVVQSILPRARKLLHSEIAAVVLRESGADFARIYAARGSQSELELTRASINETALRTLAGHSLKWVTTERIAASGLQALTDEGIGFWNVVSIRVGHEIRGALVLGFRSRPPRSERTGRHASSLAHRLAVALGNEDRERALLHQAYYDPLTGLPNRQLFRDRLERELTRARQSEGAVALLFVDLDRFKTVNDSLGHGAGDELLKGVAARLAGVAGESRTLARLGGDEFTIIAPVSSTHAASALASEIIEALKAPITMQDMQCVVQGSIGIAIYPEDGDTAETLIRNADTAMYRAKSAGRGVAMFFEENMNAHALRRLRLEQRLRIALDEGGLQQAYQRKVRASDSAHAGFEALTRWNDAELGQISPMEFIAVAEECGLIAKLDRWSLRTACEAARRWRDDDLDVGHIAVNVSLRHLRDDSFVDAVEACLREYRLPPHAIELEITESTLADQPDTVKRVLERIHAIGVRIAIDDFGTGYSSMAVLQKMPIDILKIDRAFVIHSAEDENAAALLKAMISVARGLRKEVVAEGVETPAQAALLRNLGCQFLQGYLFARPATAADVERMYSDGARRTA